MVADLLPASPTRVLDLGCGDGRLTAVVLEARPSVEEVVAVDRSAPMLDLARARFAGDDRVAVRAGDMEESIAPLGRFDLVVSGFAIHHLEDPRKRALFAEVADALNPRGVVREPRGRGLGHPRTTRRLHRRDRANRGRSRRSARLRRRPAGMDARSRHDERRLPVALARVRGPRRRGPVEPRHEIVDVVAGGDLIRSALGSVLEVGHEAGGGARASCRRTEALSGDSGFEHRRAPGIRRARIPRRMQLRSFVRRTRCSTRSRI